MRYENDRISFTATSPADAGLPADVGPLLILPDVAAAAQASRAEDAGPIEDAPAADESADDESIPSHWRSFDAAASRQARRALFADPVALRLRNRLPAAAGFDSESFIAIVDSPSRPSRDLPDQPVSLLALTANWMFTQRVLAARDRSLMAYDSRPSEICLPFLDTLSFGYASLIRVEDVTEVSCQVSGDTATGTAAFASNTARGELRFRASREGTSWNFTEFELPGWLMQCTRQRDGTWSLRSDLGPYGKEPLGNVVELSPTLDGAPLKDVRLLVYREPQLDVFDVNREDDGRLTVRAPPGRYLVQILGTTPPPPPLDEVLRADGPTVTIPQDPPRSPLPVELNVRQKVGNRD